MRYAEARFRQEQRDLTYRIYVTEALKLISENTARSVGGKSISKSFTDFIFPHEEESRSEKDIIDHIKSKLKGG